MNIVFHGTTECPYCKRAKQYLTENGLPFEEVLHDDYEERQRYYDSLALKGGDRFVPQIIVTKADGTVDRISGNDGLRASDIVKQFNAGRSEAAE